MWHSHFFNYCQHCRVNTAAIEQAVLPHASSTFLTLCIKAWTLANSAALQTSTSSQEKASVAVQLLARLLKKKSWLARNTHNSQAQSLSITHGRRTSKRAVELCSLPISPQYPCSTPISTPNPSPAARISGFAVSSRMFNVPTRIKRC